MGFECKDGSISIAEHVEVGSRLRLWRLVAALPPGDR